MSGIDIDEFRRLQLVEAEYHGFRDGVALGARESAAIPDLIDQLRRFNEERERLRGGRPITADDPLPEEPARYDRTQP